MPSRFDVSRLTTTMICTLYAESRVVFSKNMISSIHYSEIALNIIQFELQYVDKRSHIGATWFGLLGKDGIKYDTGLW